MSFPFDKIVVSESDVLESCEYEIDFDTGQLTGKKVYGIEAIKVWIWIALRTPRYRHVIYSWSYGNDLDELMGKGYSQDYIDSEMPRMLEEVLLINPNITSLLNYSFKIENDKLIGSFTVQTTYGEVTTNV